MVRLKARRSAVLPVRLPAFNSTMVRLKETKKVFAIFAQKIFQFHYGTIKSKSAFIS